VVGVLTGLDLDIRTGTGLSSVVATMTGDAEGPTLLLRADMDALPMPEDTGLDYASSFRVRRHNASSLLQVGQGSLAWRQW
jgi:metal-dependent amidase/aminoacylase/carboxypeptidase family protein